jgi:hypothetical protein
MSSVARGTTRPVHVYSLPVVREVPPAQAPASAASAAWAVGGKAW